MRKISLILMDANIGEENMKIIYTQLFVDGLILLSTFYCAYLCIHVLTKKNET